LPTDASHAAASLEREPQVAPSAPTPIPGPFRAPRRQFDFFCNPANFRGANASLTAAFGFAGRGQVSSRAEAPVGGMYYWRAVGPRGGHGWGGTWRGMYSWPARWAHVGS
jgi:hypothetical protein